MKTNPRLHSTSKPPATLLPRAVTGVTMFDGFIFLINFDDMLWRPGKKSDGDEREGGIKEETGEEVQQSRKKTELWREAVILSKAEEGGEVSKREMWRKMDRGRKRKVDLWRRREEKMRRMV